MQKKRVVLPLAQTEWSNSVTEEKNISNGPHLHVYSRCTKQPIALMHVVIVASCELARESLMGVRPCQVKVQSACRHCCCQVCPFSVSSKMPHLLRFSLQFDSTNTTKLQDHRKLDVWFFFSPFRETLSSGRLLQSWRSQWPSGGTRGSTSSRKRIEETSISLRMTRLPLGSWDSERCTWRSMLRRKTEKIVREFSCSAGTCGTVETWKLQLCNDGKHGVWSWKRPVLDVEVLPEPVSSASVPPHQKPFRTTMTMAKRSPSTDTALASTHSLTPHMAASTSWNQMQSQS